MTNPEQIGEGSDLDAFAASVQALSDSVRNLARYGQRTRRLISWTIIGLVLDLTLTIVVGVLFNNQQGTSRRIERNAENIRLVQQRTGNEVLCPLYGLFLASFDPTSAAARKDPAKYEASFRVIRTGYQVLGCS